MLDRINDKWAMEFINKTRGAAGEDQCAVAIVVFNPAQGKCEQVDHFVSAGATRKQFQKAFDEAMSRMHESAKSHGR